MTILFLERNILGIPAGGVIAMLLDRIDNFDIFRPKTDSTKEVLHAIATFTADISPAFPYVHAELGGWDYNQTNQVLLLKLSDGK